MRYLFVGGPLDGQHLDTSGDGRDIIAPVVRPLALADFEDDAPVASTVVRTVRYTARTLNAPDAWKQRLRLFIWKHEVFHGQRVYLAEDLLDHPILTATEGFVEQYPQAVREWSKVPPHLWPRQPLRVEP